MTGSSHYEKISPSRGPETNIFKDGLINNKIALKTFVHFRLNDSPSRSNLK